MQWSDADRLSIYRRGLAIRRMAAAVFLGFFGLIWISSWGNRIQGLGGLLGILVFLVVINPLFWVIGRRRGFRLEDFRWHWAIDIVAVSGIVYCFGVLDIPVASAAYMIMIVSSATFGSRATALQMANWATLCLLAVVVADEAGIVPHYHVEFAAHLSTEGKIVAAVASVLLFYVFGYVGSELATQLREKADQVESQKGELEVAYGKVQDAHDRMILLSMLVQHDVYSPLGVVSGACREAIRSCDEGDLREARRFVMMVDEHLQSIEGAVATLGLFEKQELPEKEEWHLHGVVSKVVEDLASECRDRRVAISIEGEWPTVNVQREEFYHVLRNLVTNGVKAVENDGSGKVAVVARRKRQTCEVAVSDNGRGVSENLQINLQQVTLRRVGGKRPGGGFGIGLALASNIARGWGGGITCSRNEGGGAEFVIHLPEEATRWTA